MRYANNPETRRRLDVANGKKCMDKNASLLEDVVSLRKGKLLVQYIWDVLTHHTTDAARLLGYEDHASFVLEKRMAKSHNNVLSFINELSGVCLRD